MSQYPKLAESVVSIAQDYTNTAAALLVECLQLCLGTRGIMTDQSTGDNNSLHCMKMICEYTCSRHVDNHEQTEHMIISLKVACCHTIITLIIFHVALSVYKGSNSENAFEGSAVKSDQIKWLLR